MNTPTPRTDAQDKWVIHSQDGLITVNIDFARQLERELAQRTAECDQWHQQLGELRRCADDLRSELSKAEKDAGRLASSLKLARDHLDYCGYGYSWERECAREKKLEEKINEALAAHEARVNPTKP